MHRVVYAYRGKSVDAIINLTAGVAVATTVAAQHACRPAQRIKILVSGAIGGLFPDIDSFSVWPVLFGEWGFWQHAAPAGADIYFGKSWYSHLAFMHSLLGLFLSTGAMALLFSMLHTHVFRRSPNMISALMYLGPYTIAFALAYLLHLAGDLISPSGIWGGMALFFPAKQYVGGWGLVWWWNNYDLLVILLLCIVFNLAMTFGLPMRSEASQRPPVFMFCLALLWISLQISRRETDFNGQNFVTNETLSHEFQESVLGAPVYHQMRKVDEALPFGF
ncbi:MAG: metal-dependent hydrolase [Bacteroidetes bacterium]|nr:MAG: metal-dependent hydrolase [Bacteroidota bacterium]